MGKQKYPTTAKATATASTGHVGSREHYSHAKADARNQKKQDEAAERQLHYESLTLKEKLATCIPGGSKKQRAKLEKELAIKKAFVEESSPMMYDSMAEAKGRKKTPKSKIVRDAKTKRPSKS